MSRVRIAFLFAATLVACQQEQPAPQTPAPTAADSATGGTAPAGAAPGPASQAPPGPQLAQGQVGPLRFSYDPAKLRPVEAPVSVPPDWSAQVSGTKLIATDRAQLIGRAECMYGQSGEATQCNANQEAGLGIALVDQPYAQLSARLSDELRRPINLAGREGVSWQIGAEGEGAEYILLPAGEGTLLVVRQFRESGNADEAAVRNVLASLKLGG